MDNNYIVLTLKKIIYKRLLNDNSLGSYAKIHLNHLYNNYPRTYSELIESNELYKYFRHVQNDALSMRLKIIDEYQNQEFDYITCVKIADEFVYGYLTSKQHKDR